MVVIAVEMFCFFFGTGFARSVGYNLRDRRSNYDCMSLCNWGTHISICTCITSLSTMIIQVHNCVISL
ncbi:uncharacterized protein DS421_8g244660 [Arachis hypogaea]|nr:uncharacterized protein DS421_8g244660 [Arachis hypogaea]